MRIKTRERSFSLIEIILVLSIISFLMVLGMTSYAGYIQRGRDDRRIVDAEHLREVLEKYRVNQVGGFYPRNLSELTSGQYIDQLPLDPKTGLSSTYSYAPSPGGCNNVGVMCLRYTLTVPLEKKGNTYTVTSGEITGKIR